MPVYTLRAGPRRTCRRSHLTPVNLLELAFVLLVALVCAWAIGTIRSRNDQHTRDLRMLDRAQAACQHNDAYVGGTWEDDQQLAVQCVNDWLEMKGQR